MNMRSTIARATGVAVVVVAMATVIGAGCGGGDEGGQLTVPILAEGCEDVGAVHIELIYDADVLQATEVTKGDLAENAMIESSITTPGWVIVSLVDNQGMSGEGSLAEIAFEVIGTGGMESPLALGNLEAWDSTDVFGIAVDSTMGTFAVDGHELTEPVMIFSP
jgi:hypothetical protein